MKNNEFQSLKQKPDSRYYNPSKSLKDEILDEEREIQKDQVEIEQEQRDMSKRMDMLSKKMKIIQRKKAQNQHLNQYYNYY